MDANPIHLMSFHKKGQFDRERHTWRTSCEDKDRNQNDASTCLETSKAISQLLEARGETWTRFFPLQVFRRKQPHSSSRTVS